MRHHSPVRETPQRWQASTFHLKTRLFQLRRGFAEIGNRPPAYVKARALIDSPVVSEKRTPLWREVSPEEFPLTAGKVENLRIAARAFHGLEIPPDGVMSFWRQVAQAKLPVVRAAWDCGASCHACRAAAFMEPAPAASPRRPQTKSLDPW